MREQTFFIKGRLPGLNEIIAASKSSYYRYAAMKKKYTEKVCEAIREYNIQKVDRIRLEITWYEKNKRRDPDNIAAAVKFIFDGLVQSRIIPNDGWKNVLSWENRFLVSEEKQGPKIVINQQ